MIRPQKKWATTYTNEQGYAKVSDILTVDNLSYILKSVLSGRPLVSINAMDDNAK